MGTTSADAISSATNRNLKSTVSVVACPVKNSDSYSENPDFVILHEFPTGDLERKWRQFLNEADWPSHYTSPEFFLEPYWGNARAFAVLAMEGGEVVGVATGLHTQGQVISGLPSRPQICLRKNYDPISVSNSLAGGLLCEAQSSKLITLYAWKSTHLPGFQQRRFNICELEGNTVLDLSPGAKSLYEHFHQHRRRDIRAAERNGIEVFQEESEEHLSTYWELYQAWRESQRKKIRHNRSFEMIQRVHYLTQNHRRFLAQYQGKVIAAIGIRFVRGGLLEFANNCSREEFLHLLPNDLLVWRVIQWACENGFSTCSMGAGHPFVRKWGGTIVPICRYRIDRSFLHHYDLQEHAKKGVWALTSRFPKRLRRYVSSLVSS